jgi:aminocarboxymuconate-semialdehyde decarboxylase
MLRMVPLLGGVLERHPGLRICLVHGGGTLPYLAGRSDAVATGQGGRKPSESLRTLYYDSLTHSPLALRALIDFVGPDHVLLGRDYPFEVGDPRPVSSVQAVPGVPRDDRQAILTGNLDRLRREVDRPYAPGAPAARSLWDA